MKKLLLFLATCLSLVTTSFVSAKDVDYNIRLYWGKLTLNKDNTATFQQDLVYDFASSYNGQYVTLVQQVMYLKDLELIAILK